MKLKSVFLVLALSVFTVTAWSETSQVGIDNIRNHFRQGLLSATDRPFFAVVCAGTNRDHLALKEISAYLPLHEKDFKASPQVAKNIISFRGGISIVFNPAVTLNENKEPVLSYQEARYEIFDGDSKIESGSLKAGVLTPIGFSQHLAKCRYGLTVAAYTNSILELMPQRK